MYGAWSAMRMLRTTRGSRYACQNFSPSHGKQRERLVPVAENVLLHKCLDPLEVALQRLALLVGAGFSLKTVARGLDQILDADFERLRRNPGPVKIEVTTGDQVSSILELKQLVHLLAGDHKRRPPWGWGACCAVSCGWLTFWTFRFSSLNRIVPFTTCQMV